MREIEEIWEEAFSNTLLHDTNQSLSGFSELKRAKDALRETACRKLIEIFRLVGENARKKGVTIEISHTPTHRFDVQTTSMVGQKLVLQYGVRSLTLETGFPRTATDGFMRGNSLATARISHFGFARSNQTLYLHQLNETDAPRWFTWESEFFRKSFESEDLRRHFEIFLQ